MQCGRPEFNPWVGKIPWRRDRLPTPVFLGFPCGSAGKESSCNAGDLSSIPGLERSTGEGKGYPLQYSGLESPMDSIVHGILQARILEWVAFSTPGDFSNPGIELRSPTLLADSLPPEPQGKPKNNGVSSLFLLQGIFLTQESPPGSPALQVHSLPTEL